MLSFFKTRQEAFAYPLIADIHSHLLPGIDDGVKTLEESYEVISHLVETGYLRFITTPHVIADRYPNTSEIILGKLEELRLFLKEKKLNVKIDAAAEYYLDESLMEKLEKGEPLLTFGKNYLLFETNFFVEPFVLRDFIFKASSAGYKLVMAHPERYAYMNLDKAADLRSRGVYFQINLPSLLGFYSQPIKKMAYQLIDRGWLEFLGTDCHTMNQARLASEAKKNKYFIKAMNLPLLNHNL